MSQDRSGRRAPSLPQYADPDDQGKRARALGRARERYVWTTQVETLPGVPLASKVHLSDDPSIPWLLATAKVALGVAENAIAVKLHEKREEFADNHPSVQRLEKLRETIHELENRHAAAANPGDTLKEGGLEGLFDRVAGSVEVALGSLDGRLEDRLDELIALISEHELERRMAADLSDYRELFQTVPLPQLADIFMQDSIFAELRLAGPNAAMIEAVAALPDKVALTDADYQSVMGEGDSLEAAGAEGRLFILDFVELGQLVPGTSEGHQKYLWCPVAVFAVPAGGGPLAPVAIQLDQQSTGSNLYLRPSGPGLHWAWEMAKFAVQVADGNHHELFAHLARTHLVMEAVALATHRALAPQHPLYLLLLPHVQGTLFINNAAAGGLIAEDGPIDRIFAGSIETTQLAAAHDRLAFRYRARMLPADLERRGVTNTEVLPRYPYRDDATRVWGAIEGWVRDYVGVYYDGDHDVVGDTELAAWVAELKGSGRLADLGRIETIDELVAVLTMAIFTGSAQHAAVNFPQRTDMSYAPAVTGSAWAPVADPGQGEESAWIKMMPPLDLAQQQQNTLLALGGVYFTKLGDYKAASFPYDDWFEDPQITKSGGPLERFRTALRDVEVAIEQDAAERTLAYPYLQPSQVPESINI